MIDEQTEKYNNLVLPHNAPYGTDHVDPSQSTNMEVGADWNFAGDYVSSITMYYTDYTENLQRVFIVTAVLVVLLLFMSISPYMVW